MKPGPVIAMALLILLSAWLVLQPYLRVQAMRTPGTALVKLGVGAEKVNVEMRKVGSGVAARYEYRFLDWSGHRPEWIGADAYQEALYNATLAPTGPATRGIRRAFMGFFNVTSWTSFLWVAVGLGGQMCFFGRMLVQWIASEKSGQSVVPASFWWLSFFGGVALFAYFVWRVDFIGVLGQSTGIVIYARNLRLISKYERRAARVVARRTAIDDDPTLG